MATDGTTSPPPPDPTASGAGAVSSPFVPYMPPHPDHASMRFGATVDVAFSRIARRWKVLIPAAALPLLPSLVLAVFAEVLAISPLSDLLGLLTDQGTLVTWGSLVASGVVGQLTGAVVLLLLSALVWIIGGPFATAGAIMAVVDDKATIGSVWRHGASRFWALVGFGLLAFAISAGPYVALFALVVVLVIVVHSWALLVLVVLAPLALIVYLVWLIPYLFLGTTLVVAEKLGPIAALKRAHSLVHPGPISPPPGSDPAMAMHPQHMWGMPSHYWGTVGVAAIAWVVSLLLSGGVGWLEQLMGAYPTFENAKQLGPDGSLGSHIILAPLAANIIFVIVVATIGTMIEAAGNISVFAAFSVSAWGELVRLHGEESPSFVRPLAPLHQHMALPFQGPPQSASPPPGYPYPPGMAGPYGVPMPPNYPYPYGQPPYGAPPPPPVPPPPPAAPPPSGPPPPGATA